MKPLALKNREGKPFTEEDVEELSNYRTYTDYLRNKPKKPPTRFEQLQAELNEIQINALKEQFAAYKKWWKK